MSALWANQSPKTLNIHPAIDKSLLKLALNKKNHLIFYGPDGSGKRTRIMAFLRSHCDFDLSEMKCEVLKYKICGRIHHIRQISSRFHIEINCSNIEKSVIRHFIQDQHSRIIIFNEAERLSKEGQIIIRKLIDNANSIVILCAKSINGLLPCLKSCFLLIRVPAPSFPTIAGVLDQIRKEKKVRLDDHTLGRIVYSSNRDLRRAITVFQHVCMSSSMNKTIQLHTDWELLVNEFVNVLYTKGRVKNISGFFSGILLKGIRVETLFYYLWNRMWDVVTAHQEQQIIQSKIIRWATQANHEHALINHSNSRDHNQTIIFETFLTGFEGNY